MLNAASQNRGVRHGLLLTADDTDLLEIIKVDDNTPNKQPACPPVNLLLYDTDEKSAVSGLLAMQNSLEGNDITPGASVIVPHPIDIELPSIRNVRSELTEISADVCRQESRSSYSSYADLRSIDPDDLMDACANMPPKKRFLAKESMTPEKFQSRGNSHRRRVQTVEVSSGSDSVGKDVSNGQASVFDVPEQDSGPPAQNLDLSVRNKTIVSTGDAGEDVSNAQTTRLYVPGRDAGTPVQNETITVAEVVNSNAQSSVFNIPEQDSRMPVRNETMGAGNSASVSSLPALLPVPDDNCFATNQNHDRLQPEIHNENNASVTQNHPDANIHCVPQSHVLPTNITDLVSDAVNQTISSVLGAADLGVTNCVDNVPITYGGISSHSALTRCHGDTNSLSAKQASDDSHTGVRRSKRQMKQKLAKGSLVSNSRDGRKSDIAKKRSGQSSKLGKDRVLQPGEGRVVIKLKSDGRLPIEVPGIIVRPEERHKLSKEDIIRKLVSQMQQSDSTTRFEQIQDRPAESIPPTLSASCPESVLNTSEDDALMIDEGGQTPNPETATRSPTPGRFWPRSCLENSPQVADGNVQCEVEIQASFDESVTTDKSDLILNCGNEAVAASSLVTAVDNTDIVNVGELSAIIERRDVVVTQSRDLIMNSNLLPAQIATTVLETDSTRDRVVDFYRNLGSPSKTMPENSVPATSASLVTPLKRNVQIFSTISPSSGIFSVIDNEGSLVFSPKRKDRATPETRSFSSLLTENSVERSLATLVEPQAPQVSDSRKAYSVPASEASRESFSSEISDGVSFQSAKVSGILIVLSPSLFCNAFSVPVRAEMFVGRQKGSVRSCGRQPDEEYGPRGTAEPGRVYRETVLGTVWVSARVLCVHALSQIVDVGTEADVML